MVGVKEKDLFSSHLHTIGSIDGRQIFRGLSGEISHSCGIMITRVIMNVLHQLFPVSLCS